MWELAFIASVLGSAFFLVYLSSKLENDSFIFDAIKILMIICALFIILINAAFPIHIITNLNDTANPASITSANANKLINMATTNVKVVQIVITTFMLLFFLWLILTIIQRGYMKHLEKRGLE